MKKLIALVCLFVMLATSCAHADEDPVLTKVANMLLEVLDYSQLRMAGYNNMGGVTDPNHFDITIDGRKGNQSIKILCNYAERVFTAYPVNTLDRVHCLLYYLNHFDEIRSMLPANVELSIFTWENDGSKCYITEDTYQDYLTLYREALGTGK